MRRTSNEINGTVTGPVVQAGTVEGGVHITHIAGDYVGGNVVHGDYVANGQDGKGGKKGKKK